MKTVESMLAAESKLGSVLVSKVSMLVLHIVMDE